MRKNILTTTLTTLLLVQHVLSFVPFEDNKEYSFKVESEDKAFVSPIGRKLSRFFHGDMYVRRSTDDHLLIIFKNVNMEGHGTLTDIPGPIKLKVVDHEIKSMVTTGAWTEQEIAFKYNVLVEFVHDYSNMTRLLNSDNWKDDRTIELPLGQCQPDVKINLSKTDIKLVAEDSKANCNLTDGIVSSVPASVDLNRSLSDDSDGGIKITFDRASMKIKEIELFADLEFYLEVRKSRYTVKTRMSYEYMGAKDVSEELPFGDQVVVHSREELLKYKKEN